MAPWPLPVAFPLTLLGGIVLVVGFDALAAWYTRRRPRLYRRLWPAQFALYVLIGFVAMLTTLDLRYAEAIGAFTGFTEATLGWAISWRIGPGRVKAATALSIVVVVASMSAFGLGLASLGALLFNYVAGLMLRAQH